MHAGQHLRLRPDQEHRRLGQRQDGTVTFDDGKPYADWKGLYSTDGLYPAHLATKQGFDLTKPDGVNAPRLVRETVPDLVRWPAAHRHLQQGPVAGAKKNDKWYGKAKPAWTRSSSSSSSTRRSVIPALKNKEITGTVAAAERGRWCNGRGRCRA